MVCMQNRYATTPTGLSPEAIDANGRFGPSHKAAHYLLRPEVVESLYILHHLTRDPIYQEWGWEIFQSIEKYCKTDSAYGQHPDVMDTETMPDDRMESFFLAETLKYLYLLFDTDSDIDILNKVSVYLRVALLTSIIFVLTCTDEYF